MTDYPIWKNPPILEAVLDIRVTLPASVDLPQLATFQQDLSDRFPSQEPQTTVHFGFEAQPGQTPSVQEPVSDTVGYRLQSANGQRIIQVQRFGFTFSRVGNYDTWDNFAQEARELWQRYLAIAAPEAVTRLGLRYINRIPIPLSAGPIDFKDYILTTPEIAPGVPQELLTYFMRLTIPNGDHTLLANITQVMEPMIPNADMLPLIFDIDAFKVETFEPHSEAIWDTFAALRAFKNQMFYKSITDKTRRLFK